MAAREVNPVIFFGGHRPTEGRVVNPETYVFGVEREEVENQVLVPVHPSELGDLAGSAETGVVLAEETTVSTATRPATVPADAPLPPAAPARPIITAPAPAPTVPKDQPSPER